MTRAAVAFPNVEAFYAADGLRRTSPELDFGVHWRYEDPWPSYRISYVDATGEIYAVRLASDDSVEWLGQLELTPCEQCGGCGRLHDRFCRACAGTGNSRRPIEELLEGWADICGDRGSMNWARGRIAMGPPTQVSSEVS